MKRPDIKDFNEKNKRFLRSRETYIYFGKEYDKRYIEKNALMNRIKHEVLLLTITLFFFATSVIFHLKDSLVYIYHIILTLIIICIEKSFQGRYLHIEYVEINSTNEIEDVQVKVVEYFLYSLFIIVYMIFTFKALQFM